MIPSDGCGFIFGRGFSKWWNDNCNQMTSRTVLHSDLPNVKLHCDFNLNDLIFRKNDRFPVFTTCINGQHCIFGPGKFRWKLCKFFDFLFELGKGIFRLYSFNFAPKMDGRADMKTFLIENQRIRDQFFLVWSGLGVLVRPHGPFVLWSGPLVLWPTDLGSWIPDFPQNHQNQGSLD